MPKWALEEACFANERLDDGITPWPREKPIEQIAYENWKSDTMNPTSQTYYELTEQDGTRRQARYEITDIMRIKETDGKEYLLSVGDLIGYTALGDERPHHLDFPEVWTKVTFKHKTIIDPNNPNRTKTVTDGPNQRIPQYTMDFNEENLNKLLENKKENHDIRFSVKDGNSDVRKQVEPQGTFKDTVRLFLKDFHYLHASLYIPEDERKLKRSMAERQGLAEIENKVR